MYQPPNDLTGTAIIVSGASRGIGRIYALALAKAGAKVLATARTLEGDPDTIGSLAELEATAKAEGLDIATMRVNLFSEEEIAGAVERCAELYGRVDTVLNNATWNVKALDILDVKAREWDAAIKINVIAPHVFMREAVPHMRRTGGGSIINITSLAARKTAADAKAHGTPSYGVSKAALERLTTYAGVELAKDNIAVNAVSPGNPHWYMQDGREPDIDFWGSPIVHLAAQRPENGIAGELLHTYEYGETWGPTPNQPPQRDDRLVEMLRISDKPFGYYAAR